MKKLVLYALLASYAATTTSSIRALVTSEDLVSFSIGCAGGLAPVLGHAAVIRALLDFRNNTPQAFDNKVKPASIGLVTGTIAWFGLKDFLKTKFDESSWQPYLWPSVPSLLTASIVALAENKEVLSKLKLKFIKAH